MAVQLVYHKSPFPEIPDSENVVTYGEFGVGMSWQIPEVLSILSAGIYARERDIASHCICVIEKQVYITIILKPVK